jgi:(p)ppGpp synthase/HD superfamily hydrolase
MDKQGESPVMSPQFADAFAWANHLHARQTRKGSSIPYISHLMIVSATVIEHGGSEDQAIAALLHDAAEDQGGMPRLDQIRRRFGDAVADIVDVCTDTFDDPKPAWRPRKEAYLKRLRNATTGARLVAAADKLHNFSTTRDDLRREGDAAWAKFNAPKEGQLWYFRGCVDALSAQGVTPLVAKLAAVVAEIEELARGSGKKSSRKT